jgi:hypothetical protein
MWIILAAMLANLFMPNAAFAEQGFSPISAVAKLSYKETMLPRASQIRICLCRLQSGMTCNLETNEREGSECRLLSVVAGTRMYWQARHLCHGTASDNRTEAALICLLELLVAERP